MKSAIVFCLALIVQVIIVKPVSAQRVRCSTNEWLQQYSQAHPAQAADINAALNQIYSHDRFVSRRRNGIITIPVVVHVVYRTEDENISDEQIRSQIDVLNRDYRRLNEDTFRTSSVFKSIAADAQIEFKLAVRDPHGNPTTGITRTLTNRASFDDSDQMKSDTSGGKSPWPSDQYLNVWVCNLINGDLVAYATFPGTDPNYDGIVVKYTAFGTTGNIEYPFNLGRTATHEIGHWLGLAHPFTGGCVGNNASTCATQGDRICDTPPEASSNFNCEPGKNTCTETPVDMPDQIENFMDYTYDNCMNMFSQGQVDVMRATLNGVRSNIISSAGLTPLPIIDAGLDVVFNSVEAACSDSFTPIVKLTNYGTNMLQDVNIHYSIDDRNGTIFPWTGSLYSLASTYVELPTVAVESGSHSIKIFTDDPNSTGDGFTINDTVVKNFEVAAPTAVSIPFMEDFESNIFPPVGWDTYNPDVYVTWALGNNITGSDDASDRAAFIYYYTYDIIGEPDGLVSPVLDLSQATAPSLSFDMAFAEKPNNELQHYGKFEVLVATDCDHFEPVMVIDGDDMATVSSPASTNWRPQSASDWRHETADLSTYNGEQIRLMFRAQNGVGNDLYVDNIEVSEKTVGLGEPVDLRKIFVYPNPSEDGLFYLSGVPAKGDAVIQVFNYTGQRIYHQTYSSDKKVTIDLQDQQAGCYLININTSTWSKTLNVVRF